MKKVAIATIILIYVLFGYTVLSADNELTLEAATGMAWQKEPLPNDWPGYVGDGGLIYREFAIRMAYQYDSLLTLSSTIGLLNDWKKPRDILYFDRPDLWYSLMANREMAYLRPTIRLSADWMKLDLGFMVLIERADSLRGKTEFYLFDEKKNIFPALGIELGDDHFYLYGGYINSFPVISGGGIAEMGMGVRSRGIYEHKIYTAISGYQDMSLGYKGEFRIYKNTAISPGFSFGAGDRENVYMMTIGIKTIFGHESKNRF